MHNCKHRFHVPHSKEAWQTAMSLCRCHILWYHSQTAWDSFQVKILFFLGTVFFTYKIGSFLFTKKTGVFAALLTSLNPFFFIYAFEGRMYSIMALGVTASMYYFLRIFYNEDKVRRRDRIGYVFFTLWALYSHHFAFFVVITQGLWWLYELIFGKRLRAKKMFLLFSWYQKNWNCF